MSDATPIDPDWAVWLVQQPRYYTKVAMPDGPDGCWMWTSQVNSKHYPRIVTLGRNWPAHRIMLVAKRGRDLDPGYWTDHICKVKGCVNPDHLRAVTNYVNNWAKGPTLDPPPMPEEMAERLRRFK
jgi:hypothetical protein